MATYQITGPDGHKYRIEGPEGASDIDLVNEVFTAYPDVQKPDGITDLKTGRWEPLPPSAPPIEENAVTPEAHTENIWSIPNRGGWGLSDETRRALGADGPIEALRPITNIPANVADLGYRGLQALMAGAGEIAVGVDEVARQTGLDETLGNDYGKFLPGTAVMGLIESIPDPSLLGAAPNVAGRLAHNARLAPDVEAGLSQLFQTGSVDDIVGYARQAGRDIDPQSVAQFVAERDAGAPISTRVKYSDTPSTEFANQGELPLVGGESQGSLDFTPEAPAPTAGPARDPFTKRFLRNEEQLEMDLPEGTPVPRQEEFDFGQPSAAPAAREVVEEVADEYVPSALEIQVNDQVQKTTEGWANKPEILVYDHFDDAENIDPTSLGVYNAETGEVYLNSKMIEQEASLRSERTGVPVSVEEMTNSVLFHEGLGHFGLAQQFREGLDAQLSTWIKESPDFGRKVDEWLESNPNSYVGDANRSVRAAEEILAEMSENGQIPIRLMDKIKNQIKSLARSMGMNTSYSLREIETILAQAHDAVINGVGSDVRGNGFRSMSSIRNMQSTPREKKSLTSATMKTLNDVDDILADAYASLPERAPVSDIDAIRAAEDLGMTPSSYLNSQGLVDKKVQARIIGAQQVLTNLADDIAQTEKSFRGRGVSANDLLRLKEKERTIGLVMARLDEDTAEIARSLRSLGQIKESLRSEKARAKYMKELEAQGVDLSNPDNYMRYMATFRAVMENEGIGKAARFIRNRDKLHWEDYADSVTTNFMLSSPVTAAKNAIGSPTNFAMDFLTDTVASLGGQVARGADRVYGREMSASLQGLLAGVWNFDTAKAMADAFVNGRSIDKFSLNNRPPFPLADAASRIGNTPGRVAAKTAAGIVEAPRRVNAAIDQAWRSVLGSGNLYRAVARDLIKEGKFSKEALEEGVRNPSAAQIERANAITEKQLFNDKPSEFTQRIGNALKTRYEPETSITTVVDEASGKNRAVGKAVRDADNSVKRVGKFAARQVIRFMPTLDSIARTALRNSGPTALLSADIRSALKAGGAERQSAIARMAVSSAMLGYFASLAADGLITPPTTGDYKKDDVLNAVRPPSSVKIGDTWYSYQGLDPISFFLAGASKGVSNAKGVLDLENPELYTGMSLGMASALQDATYAQSVVQLVKALGEVNETVKSGDAKIGPSLASLIGSQTQNITNPAFLRWYEQTFNDPYSRDTTGDRSGVDRILGRTEAGSPFFSDDNLPKKYDIFGRPVLNARQNREVSKDPVAQEIMRLQTAEKKRIIPQTPRTIKYEELDEPIELKGESLARWSQTNGEFFKEYLDEDMSSEEYINGDDATKLQIIRDAYEDAREDTKEELREFFNVPE